MKWVFSSYMDWTKSILTFLGAVYYIIYLFIYLFSWNVTSEQSGGAGKLLWAEFPAKESLSKSPLSGPGIFYSSNNIKLNL